MSVRSLLKSRKKAPASSPDLAGLEEFIADKDRQPPPHFAGRGKIIGDIEASLGRVRAGRGAGLTEVVTAAPGGGKTALLAELARRWRASGEADVVEFEGPELFDPPEMAMMEFLAQLNPKAAARVGTRTDAAGGGAGMSGTHAQKSRALTRNLQPKRFKEALALARPKKRKSSGKPAALLIDEAQGFPRSAGARRLLLEAHQGAVPVLMVIAGLGDTRERLAECGLSKGATDKESKALKGLSEEECGEVAQDFFERFGIRGSEDLKAEWAEALTQGTDGWPRHLTNALRGAAEAIIEGEGDLERASLADALDSAERYRQQYYSDQIAPFEGMTPLLEAVAAALPAEKSARVPRDVIDDAVEQAYKANPRLARQMPEGDVFRMLLRKGLVQKYAAGEYACPIPSFKTYVEAYCAKLSAQRGFPVAGREPKAPEPGSPVPG